MTAGVCLACSLNTFADDTRIRRYSYYFVHVLCVFITVNFCNMLLSAFSEYTASLFTDVSFKCLHCLDSQIMVLLQSYVSIFVLVHAKYDDFLCLWFS